MYSPHENNYFGIEDIRHIFKKEMIHDTNGMWLWYELETFYNNLFQLDEKIIQKLIPFINL